MSSGKIQFVVVYDPRAPPKRYEFCDPDGGILLKDEENVAGAIVDSAKTIGKKVMEGMNLDFTTIQLPLKVCTPFNAIEPVALDSILCSPYLNAAADCTDPIQRMQYVMGFCMGAVHHKTVLYGTKGPLLTFTGETYHATKSDGTEFFAEQISPKMTIFSIYGPNKCYVANGWSELKLSLGFNVIEGRREGKITVNFSDGGSIQMTNPGFQASGVMFGTKTFHLLKVPFFVDKGNGLMGEILFNHDNKEKIKQFASKYGSKCEYLRAIEKQPTDYFVAVISKYSKNSDGEVKKEPTVFGTGSWLSYLQFNGKVLWQFSDPKEDWKYDLENTIPSHGKFRSEIPHMLAKDYTKATEENDKNEASAKKDIALRAGKK